MKPLEMPDNVVELVHAAQDARASLDGLNGLTVDEAVAGFNKTFIWVNALDCAVHRTHGDFWSFTKLSNAFAHIKFPVVAADGKTKMVALPLLWRQHQQRGRAMRLVFRPGEPPLVPSPHDKGQMDFNMWFDPFPKPWTDKADIAAAMLRVKRHYLDVAHLIMGEREADHWIKCLASIVQQPGQRIGTVFFLEGEGGVGKSYLPRAYRTLLGRHYREMEAEKYANKFNSHMAHTRVCVVSEVNQLDRSLFDAFKRNLKEDADPSSLTRNIEPKGKDVAQIERNTLVIATSNGPYPGNVDGGEARRLCLVRCSPAGAAKDGEQIVAGAMKTKAQWTEHHVWLDSEQGGRDLLTYLRGVKLDGWSPTAPPPRTQALDNAVEAGVGATLRSFAEGLKNRPQVVMDKCGVAGEPPAFITTAQALDMYMRLHPHSRATETSMGRELGSVFGKTVQLTDKAASEAQRAYQLVRDRGTGREELKALKEFGERVAKGAKY